MSHSAPPSQPSFPRTRSGAAFARAGAIVLTLLLAPGSRAIAAQERAEPHASRPNVLIVILDQVRADMLGCYGNTFCRTPAIDSLARQGAAFTRAYVPHTQCSPSRAALMTGLEPQATGIRIQPLDGQASEERLRVDIPSIGTAFKAAGYATAYFGKWHLCPPAHEEAEMARYGYDLFVPESELTGEVKPFAQHDAEHRYFQEPLAGTCAREGCWTEGLADRALRFLEGRREEKDAPFLMVYSDSRPHPPYVLPPDVLARFAPEKVPLWPNARDDLAGRPELVRRMRANIVGAPPPSDEFWREALRHCAASLSAVDEQVGRLLAALAANGLEQDTIVVFVSDHGDTIGAHGFFSKSALPFEELLRIPLVIRWPGEIVPGTTSSALVGIQDVFPTLIELAGLDVDTSAMSGASLVPFLRGKPPSSWRNAYHSWHEGNIYGKVTMDVWIGERFKYVFYPLGGPELYDRESDPWELRNLAGEESQRARVQELHGELRRTVQRDKFRSYSMPKSPW